MLLPLLLNNALDTPPAGEMLQHDWAAEVQLESSWRTVIHQDEAGLGEERVQLWDRPARVMTARWVGLSQDEAHRIVFRLMRAAEERIQVPLYCDQAITTASSSSATINCPTTSRRFSVGGLVGIHQVSAAGRATNAQVRRISAVGASSLTLTVNLSGTYAAGSVAYPVILAEVDLERVIPFTTDRVCEVEATFREVIGSTALPALKSGLDAPSGFPTATVASEAYPLFDLDPNWIEGVEAGLLRPGEAYSRGRGRNVYKRGSRPAWAWACSFLFDTRAEAWELLELLDAMRGRTGAFWWPFPGDLWECVDYATTYIEISPPTNAALEDVSDFLSHVAVKLSGTWYVRAVSSIALVSGDWRITPTENFPAGSLANVSKACPCALVRLEDDAISEEWVTDSVMRCSVSVRELLGEESVAALSTPTECA